MRIGSKKNLERARCASIGREVKKMFELVPKARQRQCIVLETDRKSVSGRRSSMTECMSFVC